MKDLIKSAKTNWLLWQVFYIKAAFSSLVTLGAAWQVSTADVALGSLDFWEWITKAVGIFVLWGNNMISLVDRTASQIQQGRMFSEPEPKEKTP